MESLSESPHFCDTVPLKQQLSIDEAIRILAEYHDSNSENVLAAFMNLRNFTEGTIEFRESVNHSYPCIVMEGRHPDGTSAWNHLIDLYTGQPEMRCS